MPNVVSELIIRLKDEASRNSKSVAAGLDQIVKAEKAVGAGAAGFERLNKALATAKDQASKIGSFRTASKGLNEASTALKLARQEAAKLKTELAAAEKPTGKLRSALRSAEADVERATASFKAQGAAVREAQAALAAAGVPLRELASAEAAARASIAGTVAEIERETAAHAAAADAARRQAEAERLAGRVAEEAARQAAAAHEAGVTRRKALTREMARAAEEEAAANRRAMQQEVEAREKAINEEIAARRRGARLEAEIRAEARRGAERDATERARIASQEAARAEHDRASRRHRLGHVAGEFGRTAGFIGGPSILEGTIEAAKAGANLQGEMVRMRGAGIPDAEIAAASAQSAGLQAAFTNVKREAILELYKEIRSVLLHPEEAKELLPTVTAAKSAMDAIDGTGQLSEGIQFAVKGAEVQGIAQDPERFRAYIDNFIKAQQVMGKTISPEQQFEFAKYSRAAGPFLSDRFRMTTGVSLSQEMGGSTTGNAINMFTKQIVGGFQGSLHSAAKEFVALGLANRDDFDTTRTGEIKGLKPGRHVKDYQLAQTDPDLYVYKNVLPALEKAGITGPQEQAAQIRRLFPNSNSADLVTKLLTQRESFANHAHLYEAAQGLSAYGSNQADPNVAASSLGTAIENLSATLTAPATAEAAKVMSSMASTISGWTVSLAAFQTAHPDLSKWLGGAAMTGGVAAGGALTYGLVSGLANGFGLSTSAVALNEAAAALSGAAIRIGTGSAGIPIAAAAKGPGFVSALAASAAPALALEALANTTTASDDATLASATTDSARLRARFGSAAVSAARSAYRPWYKWRADGVEDGDDPTYLDRYMGDQVRRHQGRVEGGAAAPQVDTSSMDAAQAKAAAAKAELDAAFNATFAPKVDSSQLDALIAKAQQLKATLGGLSVPAGPAAKPATSSFAVPNYARGQ